jgi:hypothetical protein
MPPSRPPAFSENAHGPKIQIARAKLCGGEKSSGCPLENVNILMQNLSFADVTGNANVHFTRPAAP